jgi:TonB family protein
MRVQEKAIRLLMGWARPFCAVVLLYSLVLIGVSLAQETSRKIIARTAPNYPDLARKMHLSGKGKVEVVISPAGSVTAAKFVGGNPVFETSAIETVKQWRFETAAGVTKTVVVLEFGAQ